MLVWNIFWIVVCWNCLGLELMDFGLKYTGLGMDFSLDDHLLFVIALGGN